MPLLYIFLMDWQKSKKQNNDNDDDDGISFIFRKPQQITLAAVPPAIQNDFCDGENMAYNVSSFPDNPHIQPYFLKGKRFDCALMDHLMLFKLTDKFHRINMTGQTIGDDLLQLDKNTVFVLAADYAFYGSLRAIIDGIRNKFRRNIQIIVYDLGGLASHQDSHQELLGICNLSLRPFNFSLLPPEVHGLKIFAWKVAILAEMFTEFPSFIYLDTSIHFHSADYHLFFKGINNGMLSDFQFPMGTHHGLKFSTHPEMFTYIPLDPMLVRNFGNNDDIEMKEANMIIVRRSEFTR